jgi:flagellar protein FlaI
MTNSAKSDRKESGFLKKIIGRGRDGAASPKSPTVREPPTPPEKTPDDLAGIGDIDSLIRGSASTRSRTQPPDMSGSAPMSMPPPHGEPEPAPVFAPKVPPPRTYEETKPPSAGIPQPEEPPVKPEPLQPPGTPGIPSIDVAIKTQWSDEGDETDEKIIGVDQVQDLSGLILPKGATFRVDEVKLHARHALLDPGAAAIPAEIDEIWKTGLPAGGLKEISLDSELAEIGKAKGGFADRFGLGKIIRPKLVEYDPKIHGALVDLAFRPRPGVEEIEMYPVIDKFAYIRVSYDHNTHEYSYEVLEPILSPAESDLLSELKERIFERLDINSRDVVPEFAKTTLREVTDEIIDDFGITLSPVQYQKILYNMNKEFLGQGLIDPIMHDKYIEDISCDGVNSILFVYHSRFESMKTNLMFNNAEDLDSFVTKLAQRAGKYISIAEPMLDATMSDGSRIQMTLGQEVTAHGSTFTVRKFKDEPITPTDLIEWGTFSPLSIAFLWLAIETGKSAIMVGGTASGKTTALNAISLFIPPLAKIVSLEDTRELRLPHSNWIPSVTRASFDTDGKGEIDMYELLKAALRQRPEYLLVGEVRGKEALTLFQAMSTGHVTYSTMHADSVASAVHRLENPPISVPRNMLSALDMVIIQVQARVGGQRIRRNKQIIEILDIDPRTNELITNEVFRWRQATDEISYSGKSFILEEIMEERGWNEERIREELKRRQEVLEWMRIKKIRQFRDVSKILVSYFRDPEAVIGKVRAELYEQL